MALDTHKETLLGGLAARIDAHAPSADRQSLHNLSAAFFWRFQPEDLQGRSVDDLYGCLGGLLSFIYQWPEDGPLVRFFDPPTDSHGWDSRYTTLVVLCEGIPFCTASVRGELNRRNLGIHTVVSCNLATRRSAAGELIEVLAVDADRSGAALEALLFFEISRQASPEELSELQATLVDILEEVALVVSDFGAMCERLQEVTLRISDSTCVPRESREESVAFLQWLANEHMILLGYEYLDVDTDGSAAEVAIRPERSLGMLQQLSTRGVQHLAVDLVRHDPQQLVREPVGFSKSGQRSRVHRVAYPDYVEVRDFNAIGQVVGLHRFLGLYTSSVYTMDPESIPIVRLKVQRVLEMSNLHWSDHESRELERVLHSFPRDELLQAGTEELCDTVNAVNAIQERRQTRLFVRRDRHGKFVNCLVYVPRDHYNTEQRGKIEAILTAAFNAQELEFTAFYSESILVRCHFVLRVDPAVPLEFDTAAIEASIIQAMLAWADRLRQQLLQAFGAEQGERLLRQFASGFPPGYRDDFEPEVAASDIRHILSLMRGEQALAMNFYRCGEGEDSLRLRLYHAGTSLPLSDVLPILENLGLRVVTERPYAIRARDGRLYWVQDFSMSYSLSHDIVVAEVKDEFEDAFARIWSGEAENDSFNRLLIGTQLSWREIALLRAYARYLRQLRFPYSVAYVAETLADHLQITATIVELFLTRFSTDFDGDDSFREERELAIEQRILDALEQVPNLGQDRIIRQFVCVVKATLRTNFFQRNADGALKSYFSFKLRPSGIPEVPQPVPLYEMFVYSPRVEGVHLRGGKVARGGLRWSDRLEDFRTEVLGLVKAQQVKNAVIVPVGAKGGFVARQVHSDMSRSEIQAEGIACYQLFIRALLDITDNRSANGIIRPLQVVTKDDEDPYLVVAADKGTASFSDIANGIAAEYNFWLGDAFASGGSAGYDHKKMGITARGAWISVQRHFREMAIDIQANDFTVLGIGDMAGDVFGNGMLMSEHIRLVAAFNHQHIFIDPNPDARGSFAERTRLFALPRSSWMDYQPELISAGGGVFDRSAKSIALSAEIRQRFDIDAAQMTPTELISCLLRAQVDLLWNGGIGTYVKAAGQSHMEVGDKANDALRVNGAELRCRVVGEGGNLGMTQLGRVEYCLAGGRCNTDFVDNAGGVDCSDHEVNIKILLDAVVARGELSPQDRNALLVAMTDSVAELVLANNHRQTQAISLLEYQAESRALEYERCIKELADSGRLDRALEFIPGEEELLERRGQGKPLTRPELSVLVSYSKSVLKEELIASGLQRDACLSGALSHPFPARLLELYPRDIQEHRLHREIVATQIANDIVNRMGLNFVSRQQKATGASVADVACAYTAVMDVYRLPELWGRIESVNHAVTAVAQMDMMLALVSLIERATRWFLRNRRRQLSPGSLVEQFRAGVERLPAALPTLLRGRAALRYENLCAQYVQQGVDLELAEAVACTHYSSTALGIIEAATAAQAPPIDLAKLYFAIGEQLQLDWFASQILATKIDTEWQAMARDTYLEDLEWQQRTLAMGALRHLDEHRNLQHAMQRWETQEAPLLQRWQQMLTELQAAAAPDFAMLAVANRELLDLAQSTARAAGNQGR